MTATDFLLKCVIPKATEEMPQIVRDLMDNNKGILLLSSPFYTEYLFYFIFLDVSNFDITQWVHHKGINMRYVKDSNIYHYSFHFPLFIAVLDILENWLYSFMTLKAQKHTDRQ